MAGPCGQWHTTTILISQLVEVAELCVTIPVTLRRHAGDQGTLVSSVFM